MASPKILLFEAPWSDDIEDTEASRDVYTSAETLLRIGHDPVRIITRPLIRATYLDDIEQFADLDCNRNGANIIVFSAHGGRSFRKGKRKGSLAIRRELTAFDGDINLSSGIRRVRGKLDRSLLILDSCKVGLAIGKFREASGALGVLGFANKVDWVDSAVFILAALFKLHETGVLASADDADEEPNHATVEHAIKEMISGPYSSLATSLKVRTDFSRSSVNH